MASGETFRRSRLLGGVVDLSGDVSPSRYVLDTLPALNWPRGRTHEHAAELTLGLQCFAKIPSAMGPRVFSDSELAGVRTPVLYIAGQDEKLCSVKAAAARLASIAPQVQRAVFPAAGHALITVHEQAVSDRVLQFLEA